jgi:hypothetical protein
MFGFFVVVVTSCYVKSGTKNSSLQISRYNVASSKKQGQAEKILGKFTQAQ